MSQYTTIVEKMNVKVKVFCKEQISLIFKNLQMTKKSLLYEIPLHWAELAYVWVYEGEGTILHKVS